MGFLASHPSAGLGLGATSTIGWCFDWKGVGFAAIYQVFDGAKLAQDGEQMLGIRGVY